MKAEENKTVDNLNIVNWELKKTLIDTKEILGIDGERLICFEYAPAGYSIYDYNGELWERNEYAPSPFANYKNKSNLIYAGPKQYLEIERETKTFTDLYSRKIIPANDSQISIIDNIRNIRTLHSDNALLQEIRERSLRYPAGIIEYGRVGGVLSSIDASKANTGKSCGGVAAAITLHYYDQKFPHKNINSTDDFSTLVNNIENSGNVNSSTADTIKPVVKKYLKNNGGDCFNHKTLLGLFTTNKVMTDSIKAGNPVMIFAAVEDPSEAGSQSVAHAFVAHSYTVKFNDSNTKIYRYSCHFGWGPNYNSVEIQNAVKYMTIGTSYRLEMK